MPKLKAPVEELWVLRLGAGWRVVNEMGRKPPEVLAGCEPNLTAVGLPKVVVVVLAVVGRNVTGCAVTGILLKEVTPPKLLLLLLPLLLLLLLALFVPKEKLPKLGLPDSDPLEPVENVVGSGAGVGRNSLSPMVLLSSVLDAVVD